MNGSTREIERPAGSRYRRISIIRPKLAFVARQFPVIDARRDRSRKPSEKNKRDGQ